MVAQILGAIDQVAASYYRLALVVAPFGAGKTAALKEVARQRGYPCINVSLELSRAMLELTQVQRCLYASRLLEEIAARAGGSCILLDNLELLFEPSLKQDPLRLLKQLSRHRTVVTAWDGIVKDGHLIYAEPGHPEYRRYPVKDSDFVIVGPEIVWPQK
ncbi:MAG TPA: BREX-3 system P-loop-containing protein BrxF [Peptococcaceae bacterium]|nr:BREX-3 system P-loop-containing protein BrxF [Peptococcaceae bacterium]